MTTILAAQGCGGPPKGEALIRQADKLLCEVGTSGCGVRRANPILRRRSTRPSTGVTHGSKSHCSRCKTPSNVDLAAMKHPPTTFVHDLASGCAAARAPRRPTSGRHAASTRPRAVRSVRVAIDFFQEGGFAIMSPQSPDQDKIALHAEARRRRLLYSLNDLQQALSACDFLYECEETNTYSKIESGVFDATKRRSSSRTRGRSSSRGAPRPRLP